MYQSLLDQFFHTEKIIEYSLDKIREACEYFGNPQKSFHSIHVAGTNGKGSVSKMIFQMIKESGKKIGVYTSPHNIDIRERFETESGLISEEDFARIAQMIIEYGGGLSYYERCTLLAFLYFREQGCEYTVIEVGMGGRLDATNIITPILSIITSISYDHMEFLGDTLEDIAREKGGIIKSGIPVILYGNNTILESIALNKRSPIILPENREISTNLAGKHQISNARIAREAGVFLGISDGIIQSALMHVTHHGRLEYISHNILVDGAHNEDGMKKLREYIISHEGKWTEIVYCFSLKEGKSATMVVDIFPEVTDYILVNSSSFRLAPADILADELISLHRRSVVLLPDEIRSYARKYPNKLFVVFGSLYMIGEFLNHSVYGDPKNAG